MHSQVLKQRLTVVKRTLPDMIWESTCNWVSQPKSLAWTENNLASRTAAKAPTAKNRKTQPTAPQKTSTKQKTTKPQKTNEKTPHNTSVDFIRENSLSVTSTCRAKTNYQMHALLNSDQTTTVPGPCLVTQAALFSKAGTAYSSASPPASPDDVYASQESRRVSFFTPSSSSSSSSSSSNNERTNKRTNKRTNAE